eukprot:NODE_481_length_7843_cov_0.394835.p1 type:complete len:718 gc:universal NODE_481_length_7843_cov_0.394835:4725-2572(-)
MGFNATFELLSIYSQFLAISMSIKVNWPLNWSRYVNFAKYMRFDFLTTFYGLQLMEYRVHYILLTNLLPLAISFILLFLFKSPLIVFWYLITLCSMLGMIFGYFVYSNVDPQQPYKIAGYLSLFVFLIMLLVLLIGLTIKWCRKRNKYKLDAEDIDNFENIDKVDLVHNKSAFKIIRNLVIAIILILIGYSNNFYPLYIIAAFILVNCLFNLFPKGRLQTTKFNTLARKSGLKIILLGLGFGYIPITTKLLEILFCKEFKCGLNQIIQRGFPKLLNIGLIAPEPNFGYNCLDCIVDKNCKLKELCLAESDLLLAANPSYSCTSEIYRFFLPGSLLMLVTFTFGVPVLFYRLVKTTSRFLTQIRVINKQGEDIWAIRSHVSKNSCASIYQSFVMNWKYYKLILMLYRLVIVIIFVFLTSLDYSLVTSISLFLAHSIVFVFSVYSSPYSDKSAQYLYYSVVFVNIINCVVVILKASDVNITDASLPGIIAVNTMIPFFMFFLGYMLDRKKSKKLLAALSEEFGGNPKQFIDFIDPQDRPKLKTMDAILNRKLLHMTVNYFTLLGFVATLAGSLGVLGIVSQGSRLKTRMDTRRNGLAIVQSELGSFYTWQEFIGSCCCMTNLSDKEHGTEYWKCNNNLEFNYKILNRVDFKETSLNGYDVRSFCGRTYNFVEPPTLVDNGFNVYHTKHGSFLAGYSRETIKKLKGWSDEDLDKVLLYLW